MGLGIQGKLALTYLGIGAFVVAISAGAVWSLQRKANAIADLDAPALQAVRTLERQFLRAAQESFAYLASGDAEERRDAEGALAQLAPRLAAVRDALHRDAPDLDAAEEQRLFEAVAAGLDAFGVNAQRAFRDREHNRLGRRSFDRLEAVEDRVEEVLSALAALQEREVGQAQALALGAARSSQRLFGIFGLATLAFAVGVGWFSGRKMVRSIRALRNAAQALSEGRSEVQVPVTPDPPELAEVANAFNVMARRVRESQSFLEGEVAARTAEIQRYAASLEASLGTLRQTQARLVASERLAAIGTLAAGVAHEINNPLAYVISSLAFTEEALSRSGPDAAAAAAGPVGSPDAEREELLEALREARQGAGRVREIVLSLQTFSRPKGATELLEIWKVLDTASLMASSQLRDRARVVKDYGPCPPVFVDEGQLAQVFLNLLVNAAEALDPRQSARNEIKLTTRTTADGRAVAEVADNGRGVPREHVDRIWEPFFTTKPTGRGPGLGLPICRNLVEGMGGSVVLESEPGQGTVARVVLPRAEALARGAGGAVGAS